MEISVRIEFNETDNLLPESSGEYLCVSENGVVQILEYSAEHLAFNVCDHFTKEEAYRAEITVTHWKSLKKVISVIKGGV